MKARKARGGKADAAGGRAPNNAELAVADGLLARALDSLDRLRALPRERGGEMDALLDGLAEPTEQLRALRAAFKQRMRR